MIPTICFAILWGVPAAMICWHLVMDEDGGWKQNQKE